MNGDNPYSEELEGFLECPYCQHRVEIVYDHYEGMVGNETEGDCTCPKCKEEFDYEISVTWTMYGSTRKVASHETSI